LGSLFSNGLVGFWLALWQLAAAKTRYTAAALHRRRSIGKEAVKKSEKDELAQKAAQVIDSAEQRILALPATWAPPTTGHPGPSMPAADGPDALPGREPHTREREREISSDRDGETLVCRLAHGHDPSPPGSTRPR